MLEPAFLETMHEHADCELVHSDFLQHRTGHSWRAQGANVALVRGLGRAWITAASWCAGAPLSYFYPAAGRPLAAAPRRCYPPAPSLSPAAGSASGLAHVD